jgi:hypothetical protein
MAALKTESNAEVEGNNSGINVGTSNGLIVNNLNIQMFDVPRIQETYNNRSSVFSTKLSQRYSNLEMAQKPEDAYAFSLAQHTYAISGDDDLLDILTSAVASHITSKDNHVKTCIRNAIEETQNLDKHLINFISTIFFIVFLRPNGSNLDGLKKYILNMLKFYSDSYTDERISRRLLSTKCCSIITEGSSWKTIEAILSQNCSGLLTNGFTEQVAREQLGDGTFNVLRTNGMIRTCLRNPNNLQFDSINEDSLEYIAKEKNIESGIITKMKKLHKDTSMNESEIRKVASEIHPDYANLSDFWKKEHGIKGISLTTTGIIIAIINIRNQTDDIKINLEDFI